MHERRIGTGLRGDDGSRSRTQGACVAQPASHCDRTPLLRAGGGRQLKRKIAQRQRLCTPQPCGFCCHHGVRSPPRICDKSDGPEAWIAALAASAASRAARAVCCAADAV
jgi:hypothetical protein